MGDLSRLIEACQHAPNTAEQPGPEEQKASEPCWCSWVTTNVCQMSKSYQSSQAWHHGTLISSSAEHIPLQV